MIVETHSISTSENENQKERKKLIKDFEYSINLDLKNKRSDLNVRLIGMRTHPFFIGSDPKIIRGLE